MPSSDWKVEIVDSTGEADYTVAVVGDQVVDLTGASDGDILAVQSDGLVAPESAASLLDGRYVNTTGDTMTGELTTPGVTTSAVAGQSNLAPVRRLGILNHAGPPVAGDGTFAVSDSLFDSTAQEWVCSVAGNPGTWLAVGSGKVLASVSLAAQFTMAVDATVEDVTGASVTFTYDGRPVRFVLTPAYTGTDDAGAKVVTLTICRSSDNAIQRSSLRATTSLTDTATQEMDTGPLTAWPSDSAAFVVGTAYTIKLRALCGASAKAIVYGQFTPYTLYVITA